MTKRIILATLLGGIVFFAWFIVFNAMLGFKRGIEMNELATERTVYAFLGEHITEPGRYVCNPEVVPGQGFPGSDPIYVVQYSGLGHDDAGQEVLIGFIIMFLAPLTGALLLANASSRVLAGYGTRLLFVAGIGVVMALFSLMMRFGLGGFPLVEALMLTVHDLLAWIVTGLVIAWLVRPKPAGATQTAG
jgi:hypothetical protein